MGCGRSSSIRCFSSAIRTMPVICRHFTVMDRFTASPAAYAYFVADAPKLQPISRILARWSRRFAHDPDRLAYINTNYRVYDHANMHGDVGENDLPVCQHREPVTDQLRSIQLFHQQFNGTNKDSSYFYDLNTVSQGARQADLPFMNIVHVQMGAGMATADRKRTAVSRLHHAGLRR